MKLNNFQQKADYFIIFSMSLICQRYNFNTTVTEGLKVNSGIGKIKLFCVFMRVIYNPLYR